ncbi:MAG: trypsin-like peptidase domain-containing protein, partial [Planctomycetaceae bacterium]|nr:trypsin-like peptidase domain-containing protein [Planctomycetaceae bacterium]
MRTHLLLCLVSGIVGAAAALWMADPGGQRQVQAQVAIPPRGAAPPPQARVPTAGGPALAPPADAASGAGFTRLPPTEQAARQLHEQELTPEERVNIAVYETVNLSVVHINTKGLRGGGFLMMEVPSEGSGSGSILDQRGHVLTNYHVIEGAREMQVTLFNGESFEGKLVGQDPTNDLAVLKIDAPPEMLHPITLGDSSQLRVGQRVYAIGNPFGLERTLTTGVISSLNRTSPGRNERTLKSIIQLDAAINPGSSGGPLLDTRSRLIGMNTAIVSPAGQSSGVGFAIPSNTISRIVPHLIEKGRMVRPDAGIEAVYKTPAGLRIARLVAGGP